MKLPIVCKVNPFVISHGIGNNGEREFIIYAYATDSNPKRDSGRSVHIKMTPADAASILELLKGSTGDKE